MSNVLKYFHPVLRSKELRKLPVQVEVAGCKIALFRDAEGRAAALNDLCPHRRAPLSKGKVRPDGRIACPYHGWHFDGRGRGKSPACPDLVRCDTRAYQVVDRFNYLWLAELDTPISMLPAMGWEGFDFAGTVTTRFAAPLDVTLDNISEDEHFAYIHSTFGWDEAGFSAVSIDTKNFNDRSEVRLRGRQRSSFWAPFGGVRPGDHFHNEWYTRFDPVHAVYTFWWENPASGAKRPITTRAAVFLVPESERSTRACMFLFLKIAPSIQRRLRPITHRLARYIAGMELERDARFVAHVADASGALCGMRLTRFDNALIHNRKLLHAVYWAGSALPTELPVH
jgi:phenylpropionate dioxygenase-like ring-hydroxylating dioxygenase large terminal subunit